MPQRERTKVFISYAHADRVYLDGLHRHLRPLVRKGLVDSWDDTRIQASQLWEKEIQAALAEARVAILLVSPDFFASDYIAEKELPIICAAADGGRVELLQVVLKPCRFGREVDLSKWQAVGDPARPLASLPSDQQDAVWDSLAQRIEALLADHQGLASDRRVFSVPYPRNPFFTGRQDVLKRIREALTAEGAVGLSQVQGIAGLGGIGKTQTALEYAYVYGKEYRHVFWVRADTESELTSEYVSIAKQLGLPGCHQPDTQEVVGITRRWLEDQDGWLMVLDNADDPKLVKPFLPRAPKGHILVTSRSPSLTTLGVRKPERLDAMPEGEAVDLLLKRTGRTNTVSAAERQAAAGLAHEVGYLALALEQASAYVEAQDESFEAYLVSYRRRKLELLEKGRPTVGDHDESVATTWSLNFDHVRAELPASGDLLDLCAFLDPDAIPEELLVLGAPHLGPALSEALAGASEDPVKVGELLRPLERYSLVRRYPEARQFSIHRLVQDVVRQRLAPDERQEWIQRAVKALNDAFPPPEHGNWERCGRLLPHALACLDHAAEAADELVEAAYLLHNAANLLRQQGAFEAASPLYQQSLAISERVLDPNHTDVAAILSDLANLYQDQGRLDDAEPLYARSLAIHEQTVDPGSREVAKILNNLATLYRNQGRLKEAEPLYLRSLNIKASALGPGYSDVATTLGNLANLYQNQGRPEEAEPLYLRSLDMMVDALGPDHPDVATTLNNLASFYLKQGRLEKAELLYQRDLAISERALGPDHPDVATTLNNLASLCFEQGRLEDADPIQRRCISIWVRRLGMGHPHTQRGLNNYRALLAETGPAETVEERMRAFLGTLGGGETEEGRG